MALEQEQLLASAFRVADACFGIPAAEIQEVVQVGSITPVHHAPPCVAGIRNLRGRIVTVIDLRMVLRLGPSRLSPDCRILIIEFKDELVGLLVEAVDDTIFLDPSELSASPPPVRGIDPANIRGIYNRNGSLLPLLDHTAMLKAQRSLVEVGQGNR